MRRPGVRLSLLLLPPEGPAPRRPEISEAEADFIGSYERRSSNGDDWHAVGATLDLDDAWIQDLRGLALLAYKLDQRERGDDRRQYRTGGGSESFGDALELWVSGRIFGLGRSGSRWRDGPSPACWTTWVSSCASKRIPSVEPGA